ncbi:MAG: response regulator [Alphaproteobacteria bacterium]|nr:response regulator [Alphaproteobacteria bacterium]MBV8410478.1 response regulator [Alphaproteobacteria bacterium]
MSSQVVHVIDDDSEVLQALAFLLTASGFAVQVHESATVFLEGCSRNDVGCIVTDIRMPGMDGLQLQRRLLAERSHIPVIIMTGHADVALAVEAMKAGAVDFIEKPFDNKVLVNAVKSALARQNDARERGQRSAEIRGRMDLLSERERQVLDGLVAGKSNKIIAYDLSLSARTVEGYRASVMAKMQAHSLSGLIRMVLVQE